MSCCKAGIDINSEYASIPFGCPYCYKTISEIIRSD
jgi:hypothetical protein